MRHLTSLLILGLTVTFFIGCCRCHLTSDNKAGEADMVFWGTTEYLDKEAGFRYGHLEAVDVLYRELAKEGTLTYDDFKKNGCGYTHHVIIGDDYVFSIPHKMQGINLNSYRVNGNTGEVYSKYGPILTASQQKQQFGREYTSFLKI